MSTLAKILLISLVLLSQPSYTWAGDTSSNTQPPIRMLERRMPTNNNQTTSNDAANHNCAPRQCPPSSTTPHQPLRRQPAALTPKAESQQTGIPIQNRPAAKFIPSLPTDSNRYEAKQLLLLFPDQAIANTRIQAIKEKYHLQPVARYLLQALSGELVTYQIEQGQLITIKKQLTTIAPEAIVDFNHFYESSKGPKQYFQQSIRLKQPTNATNQSPVGIVDTMVEQVPALSHVVIKQKSFISSVSRQASTSHGTNVALLIAGVDQQNDFYGITPKSPLFIAGVMRKSGQYNNTNSQILIRAIDWLLTHHVKVINLSLGGHKDLIMTAIFNQLSKKDVVLVAAAGNSGPKAPPSYPAAYPGVIAVTATNANNDVYQRANRGQYIDLAAPGEDVWVPNSNDGQYVSGTSFSAAIVSGIVSQLTLPNAQLNKNKITLRLCQHAIDLGAKGDDEIYGCGLLQYTAIKNP